MAFPNSTTSPVYVDGSPLEEIQFVKIEASQFQTPEATKSEGRFWSSVPRRQADTTVEVFEITLTSRQLVNTLSFSLARFPQRVRAQYLDPKTDEWTNFRHDFGTPVQYAINDSLPASISPTALQQGASHPQHYGAGHWLQQKAVTQPVRTKQVRLLLERGVGNPPRDASNNAIPYSLGVKGFTLGYKVKAKSSIPKTRRHPTVRTEFDPFSTGIDNLGSPLAYATRENRAQDLLAGLSWRCEPQPVPDAVVSLYVDARGADGAAPVVDRFHLKPLTPGVQLNLYYSNDESENVSAPASDNILEFPGIYALGDVQPEDDALLLDVPDASVTLDNQVMQWRYDQPWWLGYKFSPNFGPEDGTTRVLFDSAGLRVVLLEGILSASVGEINVSSELAFQDGSELYFIVAFDGGRLTLVTGTSSSSSGDPNAPITNPVNVPSMRIGMNIDDLVGAPKMRLHGMVLNQSRAVDADALYTAFVADMDNYIVKAEFEDEDTGSTDNAILRYHPTFQTPGFGSLNPMGFLGGPGDRYEGKDWTPIARDFRLAAGMLHFPPTKAMFYKFEFTELVAEPYDTYSPVTKRVKQHPNWIKETNNKNANGGSRLKDSLGGLLTSVSISKTLTNYRDEQRVVGNIPRTTPSSVTASKVSSDQELARRMRQISSYFNLVKWLPQSLNTKWPKGKHFYKIIDIDHVHRVAYFVGLSNLTMYRLDYAADDDSEQYIEVFHDDFNLDSNEWVLGVNEVTADVVSASMQSKILNSKRQVRAVQFATVQSPPLQIVRDADFLDLTLADWAPHGDADDLVFSNEFSTDLGSTVTVTRQMGQIGQTWDDAEALYPTWDDTAGATWADIESDDAAITYGGITGTVPFGTTPAGRVYAAARVFVTEGLSEPLYLQIINPDGDILAESIVEPQPGQVTEWYTGYTIGGGADPTVLTWDEIEGLYPTWDDIEAAGAWSTVSQETTVVETQVIPRIVQYGLTQDSWDVDNISIFDDPIVWEFSNDGGTEFYAAFDIRNNADGVMVFPDADTIDATPGFGTKLVWKATAYHPGSWVTSLLIRPWYTGLSLGIPHREAVQYGGPNTALWDDYPEVHEDPHFNLWDLPIPQDWWFRYRRSILPTLVPFVPGGPHEPPPNDESLTTFLNDALVAS